jgi:hypothetical protein
MRRFTQLLTVATVLFYGTSCDSGRHSTAGFHLPENGDAERGRTAFVSLGCHSCHQVTNVDLPRPTVEPTVVVVLGGEVARKFSDAYLVTSIIDPSYRLARFHKKEQISVGGYSKMPHYADTMTVRQMVDIVAFLQSAYRVAPAAEFAYR